MAGGSSKLKILYLMRILLEKTDEEHAMTMEEIMDSLRAYGIEAERKGLYSDLENLRLYGMDIIGERQGRTFSYHVGSRQFELAELKLLVDSVQAAKFITEKKTDELIRKIEGLASHHEAVKLQRQVYTRERAKTENESIFYNVDAIHQAIAGNRQIRFQYFNWNARKERVLRKNGALYQISPWALSWDDENYYMIGYDAEAEMIKHYRVDKMLGISQTEEAREGSRLFERFDMGSYARKMFGMFHGEEEIVRIECRNELAGVFVDRFGRDVMMRPVDEEHFRVSVRVAVSSQFLSWVIALGEGARIIGPDQVLERMQAEVDRLIRQYRS